MPSFTDDMTMYCSHMSAALAYNTVSAALKDTSVAMVIAQHSQACQSLPTGVRLLLQNEEVNLVSQTHILGIIIDDSLSWSPHVDSVESARKSAAISVRYVVRTGN